MIFLFKLILLLAANCCEQSSYAALYSVFSLLAAIYSFSPVGLFITGRKYFIKYRWRNENYSTKYMLYIYYYYLYYLFIFRLYLY